MKKLLLLISSITLVSCQVSICDEAGLADDCPYGDITDFTDPYQIVDAFFRDAAQAGIDLSVQEAQPTSVFIDNNSPYTGTQGRAVGACHDHINILINGENWYDNLDDVNRVALIYHELGHDVLNLRHHNRDELMSDGRLVSQTEFLERKARMFEQYRNRIEGVRAVRWLASCPGWIGGLY